ncbi:MAG: sulfite exporter TauE/SafE family protein [Nocardioidaceae bacterium]
MLHSAQQLLASGLISGHGLEIKTVIAAFLVGIVVGITGMGGGALMTPALIFLGVGNASAVVTADLAASAFSRTSGAVVHWRQGSPNLKLAFWLIVGSVPAAFLGPHVLAWFSPAGNLDTLLKLCIGFALLFAASTYAIRLYLQLRQTASGKRPAEGEPTIRPIPTLFVGLVGGLLVGITSVGAGSVIMIAMLMLYPTLSAVKLVGTDLVQAVPLVLSAAASNILTHGLVWSIVIPLVIGSVPGTILGAKIAPRVPASLIRRGIVVVLTMSGLTLLDQAGWGPFAGNGGHAHPIVIVLVGLALVAALPIVWGFLRRGVGLPMFGAPTVAEIEKPPTSKRRRNRAGDKVG